MPSLLKSKMSNTEILADKYISWANTLLAIAAKTGDIEKQERYTNMSAASMKKARLLLGWYDNNDKTYLPNQMTTPFFASRIAAIFILAMWRRHGSAVPTLSQYLATADS